MPHRSEDPGAIGQRMLSGDLALFGRDTERARADSKERDGFREGQPAGLLTEFEIIAGNAKPGAQGCHTLLREAVAAARAEAVAIEIPSDLPVRTDSGQAAHGLTDVR